MPEPTAAVDWADIQRRWCAGESALSIARTLQPLPDGRQLSRQAIENKAKREGWIRGVKPETMKSVIMLPSMQRRQRANELRATGEATHGELSSIGWGKKTPETIARIVESLEMGLSDPKAAELAGISPDTLRRWKEDDPPLRARLDIARRTNIMKRMSRMDAAAERGDWKSDAWYMERSPLTRDEFGNVAAGKSGPTVNIQLNVGRSETQTLDIVDVTPAPAREDE